MPNYLLQTILIISLFHFFSCNSTKTLIHKNQNAISCILEKTYSTKTETIEIYYKQSYLKSFDEIEKESQNPIHFTIDTTSKKNTYFIKNISNNKSNLRIILQKGKKKTRDQISTDYWTFSPLFETDSKNYFLIFSERHILGEIDYSMHLLRKINNNRFVYEENLGGYATFY